MELRMNPSEVLLKMVVVVESLRAQLTKLLKAGPHPVDPGTPIRPGACFVWHLGQPGLYFDFGLQEADHGDEVEKEEEEAAEEAMEEEGQQEKADPNQSFASYPASQEMDRDDVEGKQEEMKEEKQPARAAPNRLSEPFQEGDHDEEEEEE